MRENLSKRKKAGIIDFIEVPLDWGNAHKEFLVVNLEDRVFCRIFFTNKYRQDTISDINKTLTSLVKDKDFYESDIDISGIYNTREQFNRIRREIDFINSNK